MARLVDPSLALRLRAFPTEVVGRLSLEVRDPLFAPAGEVVLVSLADGRASLEPHSGPPDVRCDIGCLSQLFCGALTASSARWYGLLEATDQAVSLLDRAFPFGPPYVHRADWF